jgi:hypothetical protein
MSTHARLTLRVLALAGVAAVAAPSAVRAELVYGINQQQRLLSWDSAAPGTLLGGVAISGLASNETIQGIDFRPNDGRLYGLGSLNNLSLHDQPGHGRRVVGERPEHSAQRSQLRL